MFNYRFLTLVFCLFIQGHVCFAQNQDIKKTIDEIIKYEQSDEYYNFYPYRKTILASDFDETTYYCGKYMYHESLAVRKKMFDLNFLIASNSNETTTIQKEIELLTKKAIILLQGTLNGLHA